MTHKFQLRNPAKNYETFLTIPLIVMSESFYQIFIFVAIIYLNQLLNKDMVPQYSFLGFKSIFNTYIPDMRLTLVAETGDACIVIGSDMDVGLLGEESSIFSAHATFLMSCGSVFPLAAADTGSSFFFRKY